MDTLQNQVLFALATGSVDELAELLDVILEFSPNPNKNARPLPNDPGIFQHTNALE
jgi:hypothetical protein